MTDSPEHQTTKSLSTMRPPSVFSKRAQQERTSWMRQNPTVGLWRLLGHDLKGLDGKWRITCVCRCGKYSEVRYKDIRAGGSNGCLSCVTSERMKREISENPDKYPQTKSRIPARVRTQPDAYTDAELRIAHVMHGAKARCTNTRSAAYRNYGGRGIVFTFASVREATRWVYENLGPRPSEMCSIDRIDNERGYEPGNLRWATRAEQARNKRSYTGSVYGKRLKRLLARRQDYTYEGLRRYVLAGFTDEEIVNMPKPKGGRPKKDKKC